MTDNAVSAGSGRSGRTYRSVHWRGEDRRGSVYENVPSTGYVGVPIDNLGYKTPGGATLQCAIRSAALTAARSCSPRTSTTSDDPESTEAFQDNGFFVYYDAEGMLQGPHELA